jgi:Tfp pilus assembly protein PilV
MKTAPRAAFSLLEVMLATAILLGCVIVLAELASIGREHANSAHELGIAQRLCENKLNEILAGIAPLEDAENLPLEEDDGWVYSVATQATPYNGLTAVQVTVARDPASGQRPREFSLLRWVASSGGSFDASALPESPADPSDLPESPSMQPEGFP